MHWKDLFIKIYYHKICQILEICQIGNRWMAKPAKSYRFGKLEING